MPAPEINVNWKVCAFDNEGQNVRVQSFYVIRSIFDCQHYDSSI